MFYDMTSWRLLSSRMRTSFLSWPWLLLKNIYHYAYSSYNLCLECICEAGTHIIILRMDNLLIGIFLSESFSNFLQKCKCNFILKRRVRHTYKHQYPIFYDIEIVSKLFDYFGTIHCRCRFCFMLSLHFIKRNRKYVHQFKR